MMVDKVVYTQGQLNTGQGGAAGHARIVFRCSSAAQIKPTSAHSSGVVGARWTGAGGAKRPQEREEGLEKDVAPVGLLSEPLENSTLTSDPSRIVNETRRTPDRT